jgi:hypothetical protein
MIVMVGIRLERFVPGGKMRLTESNVVLPETSTDSKPGLSAALMTKEVMAF